MAATAIEWTDDVWNPVRGCTKISPGCAHCYAETFAERFRGVKGHPYEQGFDLRLVPEKLTDPLRWKTPRRVFVNSMSDLFHEDVPDDYIDMVFAVMALAPQHTFQVLTKRADRLAAYMRQIEAEGDKNRWQIAACREQISESHHANGAISRIERTDWPLPNVWLGVSVENQNCADERIPHLLKTPAAVRFLSCEPLLGPVDIRKWLPSPLSNGTLAGYWYEMDPATPRVRWVIVGGESGPGARPCDLAWIRSLVRQCKAAGVACFVKQLGAAASDPVNSVAGAALRVAEEAAPLVSLRLRDRKGGDMEEWPENLRIRQFPGVRR